eukprot:gene52355-58005_t
MRARAFGFRLSAAERGWNVVGAVVAGGLAERAGVRGRWTVAAVSGANGRVACDGCDAAVLIAS